jgi:hypothetical protein
VKWSDQYERALTQAERRRSKSKSQQFIFRNRILVLPFNPLIHNTEIVHAHQAARPD